MAMLRTSARRMVVEPVARGLIEVDMEAGRDGGDKDP
jgi:hypothetical protein